MLCPLCRSSLSSPDGMEPGQDVECPCCQQHFVFGPEVETAVRYRVTCPHCGGVMESEEPIAPGAKIACGACGMAFRSPEAVPVEEVPADSVTVEEVRLPAEDPERRQERIESLSSLELQDITDEPDRSSSPAAMAGDFAVKVVTVDLEDSVKKLENSVKKLEETVEMSNILAKKAAARGKQKPMRRRKQVRQLAQEPQYQESGGGFGAIIGLLLVLALAVGGAVYAYKFVKDSKNASTRKAPIVHVSVDGR